MDQEFFVRRLDENGNPLPFRERVENYDPKRSGRKWRPKASRKDSMNYKQHLLANYKRKLEKGEITESEFEAKRKEYNF